MTLRCTRLYDSFLLWMGIKARREYFIISSSQGNSNFLWPVEFAMFLLRNTEVRMLGWTYSHLSADLAAVCKACDFSYPQCLLLKCGFWLDFSLFSSSVILWHKLIATGVSVKPEASYGSHWKWSNLSFFKKWSFCT